MALRPSSRSNKDASFRRPSKSVALRLESVADAKPETPDANVTVSVRPWLAPTMIGNVTPLIAVEDFSHFLAAQHQSQTYRTGIAIRRPGEVRHKANTQIS
jgi:hypothetical protein